MINQISGNNQTTNIQSIFCNKDIQEPSIWINAQIKITKCIIQKIHANGLHSISIIIFLLINYNKTIT